MTKCDWCKSPEHLELLTELCEHDPETQARQKYIAEFFKVYPRILGLSYEAADVLRKEKNRKVQKAAITAVAEEIETRPKSGDENYSITRRRVTENQVRDILRKQRILIDGTDIERAKLAQEKEQEATDLPTRDKVVSLRATEAEDEAFTWLAKAFGVDRSYVLSVFLEFSLKFPEFMAGKH